MPTKVHLVKAMVFPKKSECWRIDAFELLHWWRLLRVPWTARRSNQSILKAGKSHGWRSLVGYSPWGRKESDMTERLSLSLEKEMATQSRTLPGKSHGQRSLVGYSPWGRKESDTTERLHLHPHPYWLWSLNVWVPLSVLLKHSLDNQINLIFLEVYIKWEENIQTKNKQCHYSMLLFSFFYFSDITYS